MTLSSPERTLCLLRAYPVLKEGNIDLLYTLSNEYMAVVNREAVTADPTNGGSIGTGAWINKEFVSGDHTTLEVNEKYWAEVPVTKVLEFRYISEGSARLIALETGEIDVCQSPNNTEHEVIKSNKDLILEAYPSSALTYLSFNMDTFLGEDQNLRLAIAHALDNVAIIDGAASGFGTVANSMWTWRLSMPTWRRPRSTWLSPSMLLPAWTSSS